jgi:hypothetical protein
VEVRTILSAILDKAQATAPSSSNYDAASTTSTVMEDFSFSNGITYYFYIRSSNENLGNTTVVGRWNCYIWNI